MKLSKIIIPVSKQLSSQTSYYVKIMLQVLEVCNVLHKPHPGLIMADPGKIKKFLKKEPLWQRDVGKNLLKTKQRTCLKKSEAVENHITKKVTDSFQFGKSCKVIH